ncbi:MAG: carboxypeptidase regulatory-like domain-containing protein [Caldilineaceae bacterium]|nr:carboxypeptidase regulatory-like domain-containing protein [Caldilineaceae bacterium]
MKNRQFIRMLAAGAVLASLLCWLLLVGVGALTSPVVGQVAATDPHRINGRVTYAFSDEPFPNAVVSAGAGLTATTDAEGLFELTVTVAGAYTVEVIEASDGGSLLVFPPARTVLVPPEALNLLFEAERYVEDYGLRGRVYDAEGQPLRDVTVHLGEYADAKTDADGRYSFFPVTPGEHTLWPDLPGYQFAPSERTVAVPESVGGSQDFVAIPQHVLTLPMVMR